MNRAMAKSEKACSWISIFFIAVPFVAVWCINLGNLLGKTDNFSRGSKNLRRGIRPWAPSPSALGPIPFGIWLKGMNLQGS